MAYKKNCENWLAFAIIILLISISFIPSISGSFLKQAISEKTIYTSNSGEEKIGKTYDGSYALCFYKNGICEKTEKIILNRNNGQELMDELQGILNSKMTLYDKFDQFLETLKKHDLVSKDINLNDFLNPDDLNLSFDRVNNTNFMAHFAPILILGGGTGLGLGEIFRPLNIFLHFLAVVAGLGFVYCLDPIEGVLYANQVFLFPVLIGYLSAFTGLMLFPVIPGFFYMNIVAIGFTPFTAWVQIAPPESEG